MSREVRMVPPGWKHPTYINRYRGEESRPLIDQTFDEALKMHAEELRDWDEGNLKWDEGLIRDYKNDSWKPIPRGNDDKYYETYVVYAGERPETPPDRNNYMPEWPPEVATHYCMYETTTEGTPISPVFATQEELARWLADNNASTFASMTATYEQWLGMIKRRSSVASCVIENGVMRSGVEVAADSDLK